MIAGLEVVGALRSNASQESNPLSASILQDICLAYSLSLKLENYRIPKRRLSSTVR
jgi:hypothetical protein